MAVKGGIRLVDVSFAHFTRFTFKNYFKEITAIIALGHPGGHYRILNFI